MFHDARDAARYAPCMTGDDYLDHLDKLLLNQFDEGMLLSELDGLLAPRALLLRPLAACALAVKLID